jgi:hypothetical protein
MYRGLVDSDTLNATVQGVVGTVPRPSTIQFAGPDRRDENARHTDGAVSDQFPTAKPKRLRIKRQDDETFGSIMA